MIRKGMNLGLKGYGIYSDISSFGQEQDSDDSSLRNIKSTANIGRTLLGGHTFPKNKTKDLIGVSKDGLIGKPVKSLVEKTMSKTVAETTGKVLSGAGSVLGGVSGVVGVMQGVNELQKVNENEVDKAATGMSIVGGVGGTLASGAAAISSLTGTAAANFWNPVGWVAGALALGAGALSIGNKLAGK